MTNSETLSMQESVECYLSLGTNLGDKEHNLNEAIRLLGERVGEVAKVSSFIETEPWGFASENTFLNACVKVLTTLEPHALLAETQTIECLLGRKFKSCGGEYHDRIIDIDILTYGDITVDEPDLRIPHPLMEERDFVMRPFKEIR